MLVRVNYLEVKKYIKLKDGFTFEEFLNEVKKKFGLTANDVLQLFDETDTNVEEDIFQELIQSNPQICITIKCPPTATSTPSTCTDTLSNSSDVEKLERTQQNQTTRSNSHNTKEIIGAERAKQIFQNALKEKPGGMDVLEEYELSKTLKHSTSACLKYREIARPSCQRRIEDTDQLDGDACREAISFLLHTVDEAEVRQKMKQTFNHRQELIHNPEKSTDIFKIFPRFLDVKGLVNQDFVLLFNAETSSKLLEQWETAFKQKIIEKAKSLPITAELQRHISAAEKQQSENDWDSDISSFLLLLHMPPAAGSKKTKISPADAVDRLIQFHKSCTSIEERLSKSEGHQPYLLAVGQTKKRIDNFYVVVDKQLIPCAGTTSLSAFDELFKVHYVFNLTYGESLANFYTFLQTKIYNIGITDTNDVDPTLFQSPGQTTGYLPTECSVVASAKDCSTLNMPTFNRNNITGQVNITINCNESSKPEATETQSDGFLQKFLENHKTNMLKKTECIFEGKKDEKYKTHLKKVYTQLFITEGELKEVNNEHEILRIDKAFKVEKSQDMPINCNDMFNLPGRKEDTKLVLTKGVAGIGKTVSVHKFILDWAEGEANRGIDCMFLLPFREINLFKTEQLNLHELLLKFCPELDEQSFTKMCEDCKLAFIFDGLDESRLSLDFRGTVERNIKKKAPVDVLITNLYMGNLLSSALIWITSRPAAAHQIPSEYVSLFTEVRGFTDKQKEEYFKKRIADEMVASKIIFHIKTSRSLYIMCHIPVFCWITATVLQTMLVQNSGEDIPTTLTEMYIHFLLIQMNMKNQKYESKDERDTEKLLESNRDLILKLAKLAFEQLKKENIMFYEDDLKECGIDVSKDTEFSGMCAEIFKQESVLHEKKVYCFIHLTIQEFLAAVHVLFSYLDKKKDELNFFFRIKPDHDFQLDYLLKAAIDKARENEKGHLDLLLRFLLGTAHVSNQELLKGLLPRTENTKKAISKAIQYIKNVQNKGQVISPETSINFFFCLIELKDNSLYNQIKKYLCGMEPGRQVSIPNCSALAYMLVMSEEVLDEFNPKKYNTSDAACRRLVPVVRCCRKALFAGCELSESCCQTIYAALQAENSPLRELDLSDNYRIETGVKLLSGGLRSPHCKLESLRLARCHFKQDSCAELICALHSISSYLKELDLSHNDLQDSGLKQLFTGIEYVYCTLQILRLAWCNLTEKSCECLTSVLNSSSLRELDLSDNDLQDAGIKMLSAALGNQECPLEILRLSGCMVTEEGCSFLASALDSNPSQLRELDVTYNHPGDSGVKMLSARVEDPNCKLGMLSTDPKGERFMKSGIKKYTCALTFDRDTAHQELFLSEDNKTVTWMSKQQQYPDHPERFDTSRQVLCKEGLTDRCYWEVEYKDPDSAIGATYEMIVRKEDSFGLHHQCRLGANSLSWSLQCGRVSYSAEHNDTSIRIPALTSQLCRIGVYLDWPLGALSFYGISSDTCIHIHSFRTTFKHPLFPAFRLDSGSISLCQLD